ncbi:MAG TPA: hypothetical protein VGC79_02030 [Polyangiaceae bacterium]
MSLLNLKKFGFMAASVSLLAIVAAQGCSSDDTQATPSGGSGGKPSTGGAAGKAGSEDKGGDANNGGTAGVVEDTAGAGGVDAEGGAGGEPPVDPGCIGDDDCYSCPPKTNSQFLNACVEGGCPANFDNSKLSKIDLVGTL